METDNTGTLLDIFVKLFHWWNRAGMFTLILEIFKKLFLNAYSLW